MNRARMPRALLFVPVSAAMMLAGCAARSAPDFKGTWQPVNRYSEQTQAIPLRSQYRFQPSPMDGTLRRMLSRWARDAGVGLSYRHHSDFTLHLPVETLSTTDLGDAATQLSQLYAAQGIVVAVEEGGLVVRSSALPPADLEGGGSEAPEVASP
ncbi:MAG: hypothetical protein A2579_08835 [Lysobacterales bacterium RIFOXYD1_FULL_69_11]|nr:MAG: hypothetical protein A2190_07035 [Xanthomonadales bacterium RIFOXYA1_FULL_69_10]OHE87510.1 MAG: hypothetical protein A2579_08835 [Xanthomonadales bacterium RIFOXYD1_FULL_69_11]